MAGPLFAVVRGAEQFLDAAFVRRISRRGRNAVGGPRQTNKVKIDAAS